jgi:hypothetical protein
MTGWQPPLTELQLKQGDVLRRAHELLLAHPTMTIGEAVTKATEAADVAIPKDIEDAMVRALGKMLFQGFPSKVEA